MNFHIILDLLKHKVFKNTVMYTISSFIVALLPFLLMPVLTRYLSTEAYGFTVTFNAILNILIVLISFCMPSVISIKFFKLEKKDVSIYIFNAFLIIIISFLIISLLVFLFRNQISFYTKFPVDWISSILIAGFFQTIILITLFLWQGNHQPINFFFG